MSEYNEKHIPNNNDPNELRDIQVGIFPLYIRSLLEF